MAPRNNDSNTSYNKKNNFAMDDCEVKDIVPGLLHKKHKVVKLVRGQMQKIQEEGLICAGSGTELDDERELLRMQREVCDQGASSQNGSKYLFIIKLLLLILLILLLILLMVWISAGPLSNSIAHTPIPSSSFVRTEGICSLEKKYLLRWSKPEYYE